MCTRMILESVMALFFRNLIIIARASRNITHQTWQAEVKCKGFKVGVLFVHLFNSSPPGQNGCNIGRQHFQMHFLEWKWWNSDSNFTEICSQESNWQYPSISSGNGLASDMRQAVTWTKADPKLNQSWRIFTSLRQYTCPSVKAIMCGSDYACWVFGANVIPAPMLCINIHSKFNKYNFFKKMYCKFL